MNGSPQQSRPATTIEISIALSVLFDAMPYARGMSAKNAPRAYDLALQGLPLDAIEAGIAKFMRGECADVSQKYAPTPPELAVICRKSVVQRLVPQARRLEAPATSRGPAPFEIQQTRARQRFAGWTVFAEHVGHGDWLGLVKRKELPPGACWCAVLGTVFSPPPGHPIGTPPPGLTERAGRSDEDVTGL